MREKFFGLIMGDLLNGLVYNTPCPPAIASAGSTLLRTWVRFRWSGNNELGGVERAADRFNNVHDILAYLWTRARAGVLDVP